MSDLRERVAGQALIEQLLREWDAGRIHADPEGRIVIDEAARGWYDGVLGERRSALELALLGPEWTVLHSVPIGERGTDIDHVVIGPAGVYTVNTKRHPGRTVTAGGAGMRLDGFGERYIHKSAVEAADAARRLSDACGFPVEVVGILAFVDAARIVIKAPLGEDGVEVRAITAHSIVGTVSGRRVYSDDQLARIVAAAGRSTTWSRRALSDRPGTHLLQEFAALEEAVAPHLAPRGVAARAMLGGSGRPASGGSHPARRPSSRTASRTRPAGSPQRTPRSLGSRLAVGCLGAVAIVVAFTVLGQIASALVPALFAALVHVG